MKIQKRTGIYVNSTKTNELDLDNLTAYSYSHWQYLAIIGGKVVFNNSHYSATTVRHQRETMRLLDIKGIEIDIMIKHSTASLTNLSKVIAQLEFYRDGLIKRTKEKGTRASTNFERLLEANEIDKQIKELL